MVRRGLLVLWFPAVTAACAEAGGEPAGTVIVGITSDFRPGVDMARLAAEVRVDGADAGSHEWTVGGEEALSFPLELRLAGLPEGARVDVSLAAYEGTSALEAPFVRRDAATSAAADRELLLRAHLEWECVPSFHLPGGALAPVCERPETCIASSSAPTVVLASRQDMR
jgi:hypothetical protein